MSTGEPAYQLALLGNLSPFEIVLILVVVLLLFGANRLPGLAKDLGKGIREFKKSLSGINDEDSDDSKKKK